MENTDLPSPKHQVLSRFENSCSGLESLEKARISEALDWALGFIRAHHKLETLKSYPDYSNLEHVAKDGLTFGPFQFVLAQNELMLQTIKKAEDAMRDNLKAFHYKNEQALYDAMKDCQKWTQEG